MAGSDRSLRYLAIMVLPAIATWAAVTAGAIGMSPDSLFYWSAARTIHRTGSLATEISAVDYARIVGDERTPSDAGVVSADGSTTYPLTTWPPGYPAAVAALMPLTGGSVIAAAQALAVITLLMLVGSFALVASQILEPRRAACAAALVACLPFVAATVRMMWSDALFAALALIALALAARAAGSTQRSGRDLMLAAAAGAAATYVRYTGPVVWAAAMVGVGLIALRDRGRRGLLVNAMLATAVYALLVAPLLARNLSLTGDLAGGERSPAVESGVRLVAQLVMAYVRAIVPWVGGTVPGPRDALVSGGVSLAAWAAAAGAVVFAMRRTADPRRSAYPESARPAMTLILAVFALLYTVVLFALRTRWHFDFNTRMLLPAVAGVALLAVCAFEQLLTDGEVWRINAIAIGMTCLATIASLATADHYLSWRAYNSPEFLERPVARWVRAARSGSGGSVRFLSTGYMIPYIHFASDGAPSAALPDVPEPSTLLARAPAITTVVILEPGARRFRCPEYQSAYEQVLDRAADSTFRGQGFTAWWLSSPSAAERLVYGAKTLTSFRCADRH